jgi:hypothetical protein
VIQKKECLWGTSRVYIDKRSVVSGYQSIRRRDDKGASFIY